MPDAALDMTGRRLRLSKDPLRSVSSPPRRWLRQAAKRRSVSAVLRSARVTPPAGCWWPQHQWLAVWNEARVNGPLVMGNRFIGNLTSEGQSIARSRLRPARRGAAMRRLFAAAALLACVAHVGCGEEKQNPASPTQTVTVSTTESRNGATTGSTQIPFHLVHPVQFPMDQGIVAFPPRNEPNAFFSDLQVLYRDYLKRSQTAMSYVDAEGENVWLTEYFRFYLNGCSHQEAVTRTIAEIRSGSTSPVCGGETLVFPPRNLPNEFQASLEATYHEILGRAQSASYVDSEGANVWLAEYFATESPEAAVMRRPRAGSSTRSRGTALRPTAGPAPTSRGDGGVTPGLRRAPRRAISPQSAGAVSSLSGRLTISTLISPRLATTSAAGSTSAVCCSRSQAPRRVIGSSCPARRR